MNRYYQFFFISVFPVANKSRSTFSAFIHLILLIDYAIVFSEAPKHTHTHIEADFEHVFLRRAYFSQLIFYIFQ